MAVKMKRVWSLSKEQRRRDPGVLRFKERMAASILSHSPKELRELGELFVEAAKADKKERAEIADSLGELLLTKEDHAIFCGDVYQLE